MEINLEYIIKEACERLLRHYKEICNPKSNRQINSAVEDFENEIANSLMKEHDLDIKSVSNLLVDLIILPYKQELREFLQSKKRKNSSSSNIS